MSHGTMPSEWRHNRSFDNHLGVEMRRFDPSFLLLDPPLFRDDSSSEARPGVCPDNGESSVKGSLNREATMLEDVR